jgi:hypothetical protein
MLFVRILAVWVHAGAMKPVPRYRFDCLHHVLSSVGRLAGRHVAAGSRWGSYGVILIMGHKAGGWSIGWQAETT